MKNVVSNELQQYIQANQLLMRINLWYIHEHTKYSEIVKSNISLSELWRFWTCTYVIHKCSTITKSLWGLYFAFL